MQLPLLISGLDADFAAGRPYASDLKALQGAIPEAHVPASVAAGAATGLPAAADVVSAFRSAHARYHRGAPRRDRFQLAGAALRGLDEEAYWRCGRRAPGRRPGQCDAVSRLEAAVNRHDFAGALALLGQLPPPMQQAAGEVAGKLQLLADADIFLADLRQKALAPSRRGRRAVDPSSPPGSSSASPSRHSSPG